MSVSERIMIMCGCSLIASSRLVSSCVVVVVVVVVVAALHAECGKSNQFNSHTS